MVKCFDVKDYGAAGDGITIDTQVIQNTIDDCSRHGGGYVLFSDGVFCSGTLYFRSGVHFYLSASATLLASPDIADYGIDTHYNRYNNEQDMDRCFLYGEDMNNIGIWGNGTIEGNAEAFPNKGSIYRPMMIRLLRCRDIRIQNVKLVDAAAWTTAFLDSENIWIEQVTICNENRCNGDGLDFDGCRHVFVSRCMIKGTDDNLCLQAGSREYPMEHVHVSDCHFSSICAGIRIGLKSIGTIRNVTITGCTFEQVWREGIKIECTEGGDISDIVITGTVMRDVRRPLFILLNNRLESIGSSITLNEMPAIGTMERIVVDGLTAVDSREMEQIHYRFSHDIMGSPKFNGIRVDANKNHKIKNLTLQNIMYKAIGGVKQSEIPDDYPEVRDYKEWPSQSAGSPGSENYYPEWSRTAFMDIRNVEHLILNQLSFQTIRPDERVPYHLEDCICIKEEVYLI